MRFGRLLYWIKGGSSFASTCKTDTVEHCSIPSMTQFSATMTIHEPFLCDHHAMH